MSVTFLATSQYFNTKSEMTKYEFKKKIMYKEVLV
jgi:hypothetical protein